jgi:type I restriction enzyme S subunit
MTGFHQVRLGDVLTLQRGFDITKAEQSEGDVPIVSSSGISSYHNKWKVKGPGLVIGRKGTLGTVHFIRSNFWPHDTTLWVKDFKGNSPLFLSYFLRMLKLENFDVGASNPTLNRNHVHKLKIIFPKTVDTQRRMAAVLSAYDEHIEGTKRRIALLEKVAEEIYREWFVRFRFPGHDKANFVKGLPASWTVKKFGDIANFTMGQSPPSHSYNNSGDGLPFHQGVGTYGSRFPQNITYCNTKGRKARKGDILFSVRAPVGRLNISDCEMIIGRGLAALRHKEGHNSYLFYLLKVAFATEDIIGNGSIFNSVGKDELARFGILQPDDGLIVKFQSYASSIDRQIAILSQSADALAKTRDILLLRLLSGKLSVENLDIQFPPGMAAELNEKPIGTTHA